MQRAEFRDWCNTIGMWQCNWCRNMPSTSGGLSVTKTAVTVQTSSIIMGKSPSTAVINHSWFSSLKRPLKKKLFSGKSASIKETTNKFEFANHHQYYSWSSCRKAKSSLDISGAASNMVSCNELFLSEKDKYSARKLLKRWI